MHDVGVSQIPGCSRQPWDTFLISASCACAAAIRILSPNLHGTRSVTSAFRGHGSGLKVASGQALACPALPHLCAPNLESRIPLKADSVLKLCNSELHNNMG